VLVFAGVATAISAVISGSIVMVENIVYWLEKPEDCDETISDTK
jgi:Cu/Ag efflux pump CusA